MFDIIIGIMFGGFFIVLLSGAYLIVQDADKLYQYKKELQKKHPNLDRGQIKLLAQMKLEDNRNE